MTAGHCGNAAFSWSTTQGGPEFAETWDPTSPAATSRWCNTTAPQPATPARWTCTTASARPSPTPPRRRDVLRDNRRLPAAARLRQQPARAPRRRTDLPVQRLTKDDRTRV